VRVNEEKARAKASSEEIGGCVGDRLGLWRHENHVKMKEHPEKRR
jgi:hypothetical protein